MNINWKLRFQNKVTLTAIVLGVIGLVYQIAKIWGIVPEIAQSEIIDTASMVIDILVLVGIVVDPTTAGIKDSSQAQTYNSPKKD